MYDLNLPQLGPYNLSFTRNGRHVVLGGRLGHLAVMDWQRMRSVCEIQVSLLVLGLRLCCRFTLKSHLRDHMQT